MTNTDGGGTAVGSLVNSIGVVLGVGISVAVSVAILWWIGVTFGAGWVVLMILTGLVPTGGLLGILVYLPIYALALLLGYEEEKE